MVVSKQPLQDTEVVKKKKIKIKNPIRTQALVNVEYYVDTYLFLTISTEHWYFWDEVTKFSSADLYVGDVEL